MEKPSFRICRWCSIASRPKVLFGGITSHLVVELHLRVIPRRDLPCDEAMPSTVALPTSSRMLSLFLKRAGPSLTLTGGIISWGCAVTHRAVSPILTCTPTDPWPRHPPWSATACSRPCRDHPRTRRFSGRRRSQGMRRGSCQSRGADARARMPEPRCGRWASQTEIAAIPKPFNGCARHACPTAATMEAASCRTLISSAWLSRDR